MFITWDVMKKYHSPISSPYIHDRKGLYLMNHRTGAKTRICQLAARMPGPWRSRRTEPRPSSRSGAANHGAICGLLGEKPVDKPKKIDDIMFFMLSNPWRLYIIMYVCIYMYIHNINIGFWMVFDGCWIIFTSSRASAVGVNPWDFWET